VAAFTSGLFCSVGGFYSGTFKGSDTGPFAVGIDPKDGTLKGAGFSTADQALFAIAGNLSTDAAHTIAFGSVSTGASFSGTVSSAGLSGTWKNTPASGTYSGSKLVLPAGSGGTIYRGVGFSNELLSGSPGDLAPFVIVVDGTTVTGSAFSFGDQATYALSGTFDPLNNSITGDVHDGDGSTFDGQIVNGSVQGTFHDPTDETAGVLSGCRTPS
jgi:hypothetical protein